MQKNLKKVLSLLLTIVMVMGIVAQAVPVFAAEVVSSSDLPTAMEGLSIAYPYNTETVQLTGTPADHFDALTFESARGEVESAQVILTPNFNVDSFELTMNSLKNENGNIIPGWAFEVFVQHYVTVKGSGNATYWSDDHQMYNPTYSKNGYDGTFPDALIPQDTAIAAGENTITAGNNQGIWVNLNVQDAAPGTYTGFATLAVNGSDMQIPVSIRVYDIELPEEIHATNFISVWWDMVQAAEGHLDRELADIYFDYLVSKRITPMDAWSVNRWDDALAEAAVEWAADPRITTYLITHTIDADGNFDAAAMKTKLTVMINKQLEVGDSVDLFKKGYFYIYDEPRDDEEYGIANNITAQLDAMKAELAPMLDAYPSIKESFMDLKQVVTAPNPTDKTYSRVGNFWNYFINDDYGSTVLTGDSYIYVPQYQWLNTAAQRAMYANEEELWWYGCCHPIAPYPTYHINTPLVSARVESWMRYAYDIDGFLYSSVNIWGQYTDSGISLFDYWNGYTNNGTPGDQILVLPGSDYGVEGPIGTIRIENIREAQEDYEYLWMLENEYGISNISTYTANLYEGAIPSTDASIHYNNRKALLTKLEELNVAENGATVITPGQEGFVRGELVDTTSGATIQLDETVAAKAVTFDYKHVSGNQFGFVLMKDWSNWYGYFDFDANGTIRSYDGVTCVSLDDGYIRVVIDLSNVTEIQENPGETLDFIYFSGSHGAATFYLDNLQVLTEVPEIEIPTEPPVTEPPATEPPVTEPPVTEPPVTEPPEQVFEGGSFTAGSGITISLDNTQAVTKMSFDYKLTSDGYMNVALLPDWSSYFGYFKLDANGESSDYTGVTTQKIANGYIRVFIDLAEVADIAGTPSDVITMLYVRGSYTTADGEITNICINSSAYEPLRGTALTPGVNQAIDLDATEEIASISFDYLITDDGKIGMALLPNWSSYFGYYDFDATGVQGDYPGVTTEVLEDGYVHVTMEIDELTRMANAPSKIIDFIYIRGSYSTANGYIDNVQYVLKKDVPRGTALTPGVNQQIMVSAKETLTSLSVDYKIIAGEKFAVALMPNWSSYYGYFEFDAEGTNTYNGVVYEKMDDGYVRVTFDMASLDKSAGGPTTIIDFLFINGSYSNAEGYIDNVQYTVGCSHSYEAMVTAPTFTTNGFTTHTCANCGDSYVSDETAAYTASVSEWNISLGDEVSATFYVNVDSRIENPGVQVCVGEEVVDAVFVKQDNGTYAVTVPVAAAQMTDNISIQVVNGDAVSEAMTYTIRQYAEKILTGEYDAKTQNLVKAMLNYGAMAQTYFGYNTGNLANKNYVNAETVEVPSVDTSNMVSGSADGIRFYGASLVFESKVAVRFYFTVTGDINSYTFSTGSDPVLKNGMYYIEVADINPQDYANDIILTVNDALTVTYSPLTYISRKAGADNALADLVKAMYAYHLAAVEFLSEPEVIYRGEAFEAGVNKTLLLDNAEVLESVSFEYKIVDGTMFNLALMEDWSNFYSYYAFTADGASENYDGVTTEVLEDGYIRVTFKIAELNKINGTPTGAIQFLYIRGGWSDSNGYVDNVVYTVYEVKQEFEGGDFVADTGASIVMDNDQSVSRMTFDYSIESGEYFHIALISEDWNNFFGYFKFDAAGAANTYDGVVTRELSDGSIRVYMDMTAVTTIAGTAPSDVVKLLYIRGSWTTANGTISNICINEAAEIAPRGELLEQTVGKNFELKTEGVLNSAAVDTLSFEYKIVDGTKFAVALMPDWSSYHGYFNFDANGATSNYAGVTTEALDDGYIRVTFQIEDLTASAGDPTAIITMLYFRGGYCEADVYIDNIQYEVAEPVDRGEAFEAGAQYYYYTECTDNMSLFSFDYKITNDGFIDIYIGNDSGRYGNYQLYANGEQTDYDGITTEVLEDGYICVTFQLDVLSGSTGASITYLRLRATTTATGFVDNMRWEAIRGTKFSAGANSYVYTDSTEELSRFVFDYKVTNDGVMDVLIGNGNGQYGNFYFDANGAVTSLSDNTAKNYDGISVEVLGDSYIRVTLQLNELTTVYRGTPGNVIEYVRIRATTTADGYVDNLQLIV